MKIKPIHNENDYKQALIRIEELFDAKKGSVEGDELEILGLLVDNYEKEHFSIPSPTALEAILFRMEQLGMEQKDLANILASRSRASEILSGKRKLSVSQMRVLHQKLQIPAEILLEVNKIK